MQESSLSEVTLDRVDVAVRSENPPVSNFDVVQACATICRFNPRFVLTLSNDGGVDGVGQCIYIYMSTHLGLVKRMGDETKPTSNGDFSSLLATLTGNYDLFLSETLAESPTVTFQHRTNNSVRSTYVGMIDTEHDTGSNSSSKTNSPERPKVLAEMPVK